MKSEREDWHDEAFPRRESRTGIAVIWVVGIVGLAMIAMALGLPA